MTSSSSENGDSMARLWQPFATISLEETVAARPARIQDLRTIEQPTCFCRADRDAEDVDPIDRAIARLHAHGRRKTSQRRVDLRAFVFANVVSHADLDGFFLGEESPIPVDP